mmetsp:Transcript_4793/g.20349  ORF Transcript_4793/g.20349 Transcript_4793/m.20349 type:complete len:261 (+) Transcript_4793:2006-2788(+)
MPPTWNRGMKFRQTSSDVRPDDAAMAVAPRTSWCVVMGTTFFLPVEPDVCSTSATRASWPPAFGDLAAGDLGAAPEKGVSPPLDPPAFGVGKSRGVPAAAAGASKSASWNGPPTPSVRYGSPASVNAPPTCASGVMASGAMPRSRHSFCISGAVCEPPWYTSATTPVARSSVSISCGVVPGFTGTAVCLSMTHISTDMSSGPFGTATPTRDPGVRTPHDFKSASVRYTSSLSSACVIALRSSTGTIAGASENVRSSLMCA